MNVVVSFLEHEPPRVFGFRRWCWRTGRAVAGLCWRVLLRS